MVLPTFGVKTYFGYIGRKDADYKSLMDAVDAALLKIKKDGRMAQAAAEMVRRHLRHARTAVEPIV